EHGWISRPNTGTRRKSALLDERWNLVGTFRVGNSMDEKVDDQVPDLKLRNFEHFYAAEVDDLYRTLALVLRDADLAHEAVDEAMARAFQRWNKVRSYENPTGWVYRVAMNWALSRLRRRKREVRQLAEG